MTESIKLLELHAIAAAMDQAKHMEGNKEKLGNLRAGNSGAISETGAVVGSCHRMAHLRMLGVEVESPSDSTLLMFEGGFQNEESWLKKLRLSWQGVVLSEEEIPTEWLTSTGVKVTGRPDIVLCDAGSKPQLGLELKGIGSMWTLRDVWAKGDASPKLAHLCQAGHYSWQLGEKFGYPNGLPYKIVYTSYVNFVVPDWASSMFPRPGDPGSENIEFNEKGGIKHLKPQMVVYDLEWDKKSGRLKFRREDADSKAKWTESPVTVEGIQQFYEIAGSQKLDGRPETLSGSGVKQKFSNCGYCPLNPVCAANEDKQYRLKNYNLWLRDVRRLVTGGR